MKVSGVVLLIALSATPGAAIANERAATASCGMTGALGCAPDGVCVDIISSRLPINFNFAKERYSSSLGTGKITQSWKSPDGSHNIRISSPPASAEVSFSPDWRTATVKGRNGFTTLYACEVTYR